jgi:hypothetical protein
MGVLHQRWLRKLMLLQLIRSGFFHRQVLQHYVTFRFM